MTTAFTYTDLIETARVLPGKRIDLRKDFDPGLSGGGWTKERGNQRLTLPEKDWKFSAADIGERDDWDAYLDAHEDLFNHASTPWATWYVLPADRKWGTHRAVAAIIHTTLADLKVDCPTVTEEARQELRLARLKFEDEDGGGVPMTAGRSAGKNARMADAP